jgi:hypothetical protein
MPPRFLSLRAFSRSLNELKPLPHGPTYQRKASDGFLRVRLPPATDITSKEVITQPETLVAVSLASDLASDTRENLLAYMVDLRAGEPQPWGSKREVRSPGR